MQHPIGAHALLANSQTAALLDPAGGVAWCCWPRFDSEPLFMDILDDARGGVFTLRPAGAARVEQRAYVGPSLVVRTTWRQDAARVVVDEALLLGGSPALARVARAVDAPVRMEVRLRPRDGSRLIVDGTVLHVDGATRLRVTAPQRWSLGGAGARCGFVATRGLPAALVMSDAGSPRDPRDTGIGETLRLWGERLAGIDEVVLRPEAERELGAARCGALLQVSGAVLSGLRSQSGGIVAAPTSSLPQWPGSARCWDYRFCWLRDAALAARAMLRLGLRVPAHELAAFLGDVVVNRGVRALVRVDGSDPPAESLHPDISGYRGARPVRFGNAAAEQLQVDVAGEVLELADALDVAGALPTALKRAVPLLAGWIRDHWQAPDHGIWEIRGTPRRYTHSRVTAWAGADSAARLAERGDVSGDATAWRALADVIRGATLPPPGAALHLRGDGGGGDAALTTALLNGFLDPRSATAGATLDLIERDLTDNGMLQRYRGTQDEFDDPCAPFVFPTFWMATAAAAAGRDGSTWLEAACNSAGPLGLLGEVRDPVSGGPLGNYPQVQSHAALVLALTAPPGTSP